MTRFTPAQFFAACEEFGALSEALPASVLIGLGEFAQTTLAQASKASGGVSAKASDFAYKKPRVSAGQASAKVVGHGFAVLDEYGSYKKPGGYPIEPKKSGKRQINAKRASYETRARAASRALGYSRSVLSNGGGFVAAYVSKHPPQKAHPFTEQATAVIGVEVDKAFNKAVSGVIVKAFK